MEVFCGAARAIGCATHLGAALIVALETSCVGNGIPRTVAHAPTDSQTTPSVSAPGAGPTPLQRLTSAEYSHSVTDILQLQQLPAVALPPDETGGTLAVNTGAVIDSLTLQQYLDAATTIVAAVDANTLLGCKPAESQFDCSTMVVWGSEYGEGHDVPPIPLVIGGGGGGAYKTGRYIDIAAPCTSRAIDSWFRWRTSWGSA